MVKRIGKNVTVVDSNDSTLFFDSLITFRSSKDMIKIIDSFVKNLKDPKGLPLFTSRSHFIKSSIIYYFNYLKSNSLV